MLESFTDKKALLRRKFCSEVGTSEPTSRPAQEISEHLSYIFNPLS